MDVNMISSNLTMAFSKRPSDAVHWYMSEVASQIIAETGIPSDRHHLGKLIIHGLKGEPSFVLQIDGGTGESETCGSVLKRTVQCARAFQKLGLARGDVITILSPSHINVCIPMYAALYLGVAVATIDFGYGLRELQDILTLQKPKVVFCQSEKAPVVQKALDAAGVDSRIITFGKAKDILSFSELLDEGCSQELEGSNKEFKASDFDPDETLALLISTSGTTGSPKSIAVSHKNLVTALPYMWNTYLKFPTPTRLSLSLSPLQWYSAMLQFVLSPILRHTRLQTSLEVTPEHIFELINKYRPTFTMIGSSTVALLWKNSDKCDITCFETIFSAGSAAYMKSFEDIKVISPNTRLMDMYGQSEVGTVFSFDHSIPKSLGKVGNHLQDRLVNVETLEEITEPNVPGELWVKGPSVFKGYYNRPKETAETIVEDGWLRTGDIMYRDKHGYYYFVDRYKMMLKYKNYQISPVELEKVISMHPGVYEVAVTGKRDPLDGDLPMAFVVPVEGATVTAEEIKDLVKRELVDQKQLRGGVVFIKDLPLTATSKIDRQKLKEIANEKN